MPEQSSTPKGKYGVRGNAPKHLSVRQSSRVTLMLTTQCLRDRASISLISLQSLPLSLLRNVCSSRVFSLVCSVCAVAAFGDGRVIPRAAQSKSRSTTTSTRQATIWALRIVRVTTSISLDRYETNDCFLEPIEHDRSQQAPENAWRRHESVTQDVMS